MQAVPLLLSYEKALVELDAFVTKLGFKVIAGATFVGEHSYSSEKYPVASGRPDADDLEYAKLFGEKIRAKIAAAEDMEKLYGVEYILRQYAVNWEGELKPNLSDIS